MLAIYNKIIRHISVSSSKETTEMANKELVFVPTPGAPTHMSSPLQFANYLLEQDKQLSITFFLIKFHSFSTNFTSSNPNIRFIEVPNVNQVEEEDMTKKCIETSGSIFIQNHRSVVQQEIIDHIQSKSIPLVGLVLDFFCSSMIDVADELGVPSYVFFTSSAAFLRLMLHIPDHYSETGREFYISDPDSIIPGFVNPVPSVSLPSFLLDKDGGGYETMKNHGRRFKDAKGIFINTFAELEPIVIDSLKSDTGTPPIFPVGPLLNLKGREKAGSNSDPEEIMKWLVNQPPSSVLYLCFGSRGGFGPPQLAEIATAIERSGKRFLWSVRQPPRRDVNGIPMEGEDISPELPEGFVERTENRGMVCGWAPQAEVLGHESVGGFVSHCGWNSILESLWHGVPIAAWPLYAEQQMNAFYLVKELGLAVELKMDYRMENSSIIVMADEIEDAIENLMDLENPIRKRVKEMSEVSRKAGMVGGSSIISIHKFIEGLL